MVLTTLEFVKSTLALMAFVLLGVAGVVDDVDITSRGIMVMSTGVPSFAFGNVAYHNGMPSDRLHELGHLRHEDELGIAYLPIAGLTSIIGLWLCDTKEQYYSLWTERTAEQYAEEIR